MSSKIDASVRYMKSHEWARLTAGEVVVGISDHAQEALNDLVYVDLPRAGTAIKAGDRFGTVESVKAASDVYAPVSGTIVAVNSALEKSPEIINQDPYQAGWLIKIKPADPQDLGKLLDAAGYEEYLKSEEK